MMRVLAMILLAFAALHAIAAHAVAAPPAPKVAIKPAELAKNIEAKYSIVVAPTPPQPQDRDIRFRPAQPSDPGVLRYLLLIDEELDLYPRKLLRATGLKTIALVQDLTGDGEWGPYQYDSTTGTMYVNVRYLNINPDYDAYLRHSIHHLLGWALDWRINANAAKDDPAWSSLNAPGFKYPTAGSTIGANYDREHKDASPGFFSLSSKGSPHRDKANVFCGLMMPDEKKLLDKQIEHDPVLAAKVKYMKSVMDYFAKAAETDQQRQLDVMITFLATRRPGDAKSDAELRKYQHDTEYIIKDNAAAINEKTWSGRTPLIMALLFGHGQIAKSMLNVKGIDFLAADDNGWTPLHAAAIYDNPAMTLALLEAGATPDVKDKFGGTSVDWARRLNSKGVLRVYFPEFHDPLTPKPKQPARR